MTKLSTAIAGKPAATAATRLQTALAGARPMKPVVVHLPSGPLPAVMTILGTERLLDLDGEVLVAMSKRGLEQNGLNAHRYELELAKRTLAEVVLDSEANPIPLGTLADWGAVTPEAISALWMEFSELREEYDPAASPLTSIDVLEIRDAISKKNAQLLRSFGAQRLSIYLLTTADQPADSPTARSSSGDSSPES